MKKFRNVFWGIFWILGAVLLIASQFVSFANFGFWTILLCLLMFAGIIQGIINRSFFSILIPIAIIYFVLQRSFDLFYIKPWILFMSAVIGSCGLSMIFKRKPGKHGHCNDYYHTDDCDDYYDSNHHDPDASKQYSGENNPSVSINFSSHIRYLQASPLLGGDFNVSFGSLEIYFDQSTLLENGTNISVSCSFGGMCLYVPRTWRIEDNTTAMFSGFSEKPRNVLPDVNAPVLRVNGSINFGQIDIIYI